MKLIIAQGNPGSQYEQTRHNIGFMALDAFAARHGASWKADSKLKAVVAELQVEGEKVLLVKPLSYYNETGQVARALVDFYKLTPATDVLAIYDELALPFGTIRVREKGSDAGNNGIKSLNAHLGPVYWRIRIGIWTEQRDLMDDAAFVLARFNPEERTQLQEHIDTTVASLINQFVIEKLESSSYRQS